MIAEDRILSEIDHPFLALCYGTICSPTHIHYVLKHCEGGDLYSVLNANGEMKEVSPGPRARLGSARRHPMTYSTEACAALGSHMASPPPFVVLSRLGSPSADGSSSHFLVGCSWQLKHS